MTDGAGLTEALWDWMGSVCSPHRATQVPPNQAVRSLTGAEAAMFFTTSMPWRQELFDL